MEDLKDILVRYTNTIIAGENMISQVGNRRPPEIRYSEVNSTLLPEGVPPSKGILRLLEICIRREIAFLKPYIEEQYNGCSAEITQICKDLNIYGGDKVNHLFFKDLTLECVATNRALCSFLERNTKNLESFLRTVKITPVDFEYYSGIAFFIETVAFSVKCGREFWGIYEDLSQLVLSFMTEFYMIKSTPGISREEVEMLLSGKGQPVDVFHRLWAGAISSMPTRESEIGSVPGPLKGEDFIGAPRSNILPETNKSCQEPEETERREQTGFIQKKVNGDTDAPSRFTVEEEDNSKFGEWGFSLDDLEDLDTSEYMQNNFLVSELINQGDLVLLSGDPKVGKTNLAYNLVRSVLFGEEFLGRPVRQIDRVVIIQNDETKYQWKTKLFEILGGKLVPKERLQVISGWRYDSKDHPEQLEQFLNLRKTDVLIVDNLTRVAPTVDQNTKDILPVIEYFHRITRQYGITVIMLHHNNKDESKRSIRKVRGYSGITAEVDLIMVMERKENKKTKETNTYLSATGRMILDCLYKIRFEDGFRLVWTQENTDELEKEEFIANISIDKQRISEYLASVNRPVTYLELVSSLGLSLSRVRKIVGDITDSCFCEVTRVKRVVMIGLYQQKYSCDQISSAYNAYLELKRKHSINSTPNNASLPVLDLTYPPSSS